jgi:phage tail-like protein
MIEPLLLNFRFAVSFLGWGGGTASVDTRFQSVSGIGATVTTSTVAQGGQNLYTQSLPDKVGYSNLTLTRGRVIKSTLNGRFEDALARFEFKTTDVLVMLLGDLGLPLCAWKFYRAWPVKWTTSDLSATTPAILIDTMELAYTRMEPIRL